jgi:hypothetical protein
MRRNPMDIQMRCLVIQRTMGALELMEENLKDVDEANLAQEILLTWERCLLRFQRLEALLRSGHDDEEYET